MVSINTSFMDGLMADKSKHNCMMFFMTIWVHDGSKVSAKNTRFEKKLRIFKLLTEVR